MQDFGEDNSENESDEERGESGEEVTSESEIEDEASNEEEWTSSGDSKSDDEDVEARAAAALKKLVPGNLEDLAKVFFCNFSPQLLRFSTSNNNGCEAAGVVMF